MDRNNTCYLPCNFKLLGQSIIIVGKLLLIKFSIS